MSLRTRLILSYTLIVVLCLGIAAVAVSVMLQGYRDRFTTARLDDMTVPIYVQARSLLRRQASLDEVWENLDEQAQRTGVYILLVDEEGGIIRQATPQGRLEQQTIELPPEGLPSDITKPYHGTYETPGGQAFIFAAYPISRLFSSQDFSAEAIILALPRRGVLALWADMIRPFLWAGLIALGTSVGIAVFLARSVYRPIQRVTEAAGEVAQGRYDREIPVTGPREVIGLARGFNQMAQQVKLSQQRLRDFVADVSHQLRSPLTSIRGFAQAIVDGTAPDSDARIRAAQVIEEESRRMIRQVGELLELSRMQSGQIEMSREPVDIGELLEHCREIFSARAEEKGLLLRAEVGPLAPVVGDIDRLEHVFNNLLDNAIKHTPAGGKVGVIARRATPDAVEIRVADGGPGIPAEQLPHIFERFYRASGVESGSGLGLAIAREIVLAHNGTIEVSSTPDEGTEFVVRLPVGSSAVP